MKRRVVLNFADDLAGPLRLNIGDVLLIARRDEDGVLKIVKELQYFCNSEKGEPIIAPAIYDSLDEYIEEALSEGTLNVEILGHSPYSSSHHILSSVTKNCTLQSYSIDEVTALIESDILKKNITKTTISLIICEAGAETKEFPSIAEQMLELFKDKPFKITARKGFVYMRNREKIYSLSTFDTLLHKAYLGKENPPDTFLEWFSFPVLRGLRTFLDVSKLHTYNNSTPLGEKFAFIKNDLNQTLKIDKHLYDLYHLSHPKPEIKLENYTKEDFIKLASMGIQSNKNEKLYKKSEIVLKQTDKIYPAIILQIDLKNYKIRDQLFDKIDLTHEIIGVTPSLKHAERLTVLLNIIETYINGRYFLNLPVDSMEPLLNILNKIIAQKGQFDEQDFLKIEKIAEYIKTDRDIALDAAEYVRLSGIQWPSDVIATLDACRQMNEGFSNRLEAFCKIIKTENQLIENGKIYTLKSDKVGITDQLKPKKEKNEINEGIERLRQFIHHQIQEASYLFGFNKFTSAQTEILIFLLRLIHTTQKQEIKNNESVFFVPLMTEAIQKLVSIGSDNPRLKLIEEAVDSFVKKNYNISERELESIEVQAVEFEFKP